jgi:hypothetical protein
MMRELDGPMKRDKLIKDNDERVVSWVNRYLPNR